MARWRDATCSGRAAHERWAFENRARHPDQRKVMVESTSQEQQVSDEDMPPYEWQAGAEEHGRLPLCGQSPMDFESISLRSRSDVVSPDGYAVDPPRRDMPASPIAPCERGYVHP